MFAVLVAKRIFEQAKAKYPKSWARTVNSSIETRYIFLLNIHGKYQVPFDTPLGNLLDRMIIEESGMKFEVYEKLWHAQTREGYFPPIYAITD